MEGNYRFLDAMAGVDLCEAMNRCMENMELLQIQDPNKENFFWMNTDVAYSDDEASVKHTVEQLRRKVLDQLRDRYGVDTSDDALRRAVEEHNEVCRIISEIGESASWTIPPSPAMSSM